MTNRLTNTELISLIRDLVLADYEHSRSYQSFLQTSREYFTTSTTNVRMLTQMLMDLINGRSSRNEPITTRGNNFSYFSNPIPSSFNRRRPLFNNSNTEYNTFNNSTSDTINPMYRTLPRRINRNRTHLQTEDDLNIDNILTNLLTAPLLNRRSRIPTPEDISNNCTRLIYGDISSNQTICPIDRMEFSDEDIILKINHCGHIFKEENLLRVFERNSKCPLCRHDILERNNNGNRNNNETNESEIPNFFSGSNSFVDQSGNNISVEYTVSNYI